MITSNAFLLILFTVSVINLNTKANAEVRLMPLHPHPNVQDKHRRTQEHHGFKNSVVYDLISLLRSSGDRGERLLTYYKQARFQKHEERRRDKETPSRLGQSKIPSKARKTKAVFPLFQGLGSHYCTVHVGTPPQVTTLLVDTGSEMTGFPCSGCENCGNKHTNPYFEPDKSTSFEVVNCNECTGIGASCSNDQCIVGVSYLEGSSWHGYQARDVFSLTKQGTDAHSDLQVPFTFACETRESGQFDSQLENGMFS